MGAVQRIQSAGFNMEVKNGKLIVKPSDRLRGDQRTYIRKHKSEIIDELTRHADETKIRTWLSHIGEHDREIINEVLTNCRTNQDTRDYFLRRAS